MVLCERSSVRVVVFDLPAMTEIIQTDAAVSHEVKFFTKSIFDKVASILFL